MITHIVLLKFKKEINLNKVINNIEETQELFRKEINVIKNIKYGKNFSIKNKGYDYCLNLEFENDEDLQKYIKHELHINSIRTMSEFVEDMIVIDYNYKNKL